MALSKGTVLALNRRRRTAIVELDAGRCSVLAWLRGDGPEFNDVLRGHLDRLGGQDLYNETRCEWFSVDMRVCGCSFRDAVHEAD
jgi:hypothetical protein